MQAAIDASEDGDTVLVSPGTYTERIDFLHKEITVQGEAGPSVTTLDGGGTGPVVDMATDPGESPALRGFTVRNGGDEGGIDTTGGPALIEGNTITGNLFCTGGAVEAEFSNATIRSNVIWNNAQQGCIGGSGGGGISLAGAGTVSVLDNVIAGNSHSSHGGGVSLFAAGTPTIAGNDISNNSGGSEGGAIWIVNRSNALIVNNVIYGNHATDDGGGIYWFVGQGEPGPRVVNNTIAMNTASEGLAVYSDGFATLARLQNNVLIGPGITDVVHCGYHPQSRPGIEFNDVFNGGSGPRYGGRCSNKTSQDGNISSDPLFEDALGGDFHLRYGSPAVDAALDAVAPPLDIDGDPRPMDGDGDGTFVADMGADEIPLPPRRTHSKRVGRVIRQGSHAGAARRRNAPVELVVGRP